MVLVLVLVVGGGVGCGTTGVDECVTFPVGIAAAPPVGVVFPVPVVTSLQFQL